MMLHRNNPRSTHVQEHPISRTIQYKKVTKPLLERKRRARINRCLDELKDLMVGALEAEVENVNKLEKADILELTVRHLQRITKPRDPAEEAQRFQAGFNQCASEACGFLLSLPGLDSRVGRRLVSHLGHCLTSPLSVQVPSRHHCYSPPCSPAAPHELSPRPHTHKDFYSPFTTVLSAHDLTRPINGLLMTVKENDDDNDDSRDMWRPW